jgi:hypothetical protein
MLRLVLLTLLLAGLIFAAWLPAKNVVAQANLDLLQKVEARLGKPLSGDQRPQFARTATSLSDALLPPQQKFAQTIAQIFKLPLAEVQTMVPTTGAGSNGFEQGIIPKLETRIGRSFTPQELQQVRIADNAKQAEMSEIQSQFVPRLAQITGLSKEQLLQLLPTTGI